MIGEFLTLIGAALILLAAIGVVRFGDPLARMHALAKASTLGILLILGGTMINLHSANDITSVLLAAILQVLMSPPASNMVSRAIYLSSDAAHGDEVVDEGAVPLGLHPDDVHPSP